MKNSCPASTLRPTRLEVSVEAVVHNVKTLKDVSGGKPVLAVVKADAYGLGALPVAKALSREKLARFFGIATLGEATALRDGGIDEDLLVLGPLSPGEISAAADIGVAPSIYNDASFEALVGAAAKRPGKTKAHIKVDSGMGRLGFGKEGLEALLKKLSRNPKIEVEGLFSTLASADNPKCGQTARQLETFLAMVEMARSAGVEPEFVHLANSAGLISHPGARLSLVRPGLAMYGMLPSRQLKDPGLKPAVKFETRILQIKDFPRGSEIGYSATYVTRKRETLALLPLGYADGLPRVLAQNGGFVLVKGRKAPFRGRISMDICVVSVQGIGASEGDKVILWGKDGKLEVTPWNWADMTGTIPYEITCGLGPRVPKVYV